MIPTSKSWEVLLFAIPSTRSFMTSEFDSTVYELPVTSTFPKTSRSEDITMAPLVLLIKESSRKFPVSNYKGRENCNDFSIGIELEGCDKEGFEEEQYFTLQELTRCLLKEFSIPKESIVGHVDIAPGRKTDPGPYFSWDKYTDKL